MNILITHLCDDEDTRQVRLSIQNRYEQLMSIVDNKIQAILLEHQSNFSTDNKSDSISFRVNLATLDQVGSKNF
jgi:hypothetical protein